MAHQFETKSVHHQVFYHLHYIILGKDSGTLCMRNRQAILNIATWTQEYLGKCGITIYWVQLIVKMVV